MKYSTATILMRDGLCLPTARSPGPNTGHNHKVDTILCYFAVKWEKNPLLHVKHWTAILLLFLTAKTVADLKLAVTSELNILTYWLRANRLSLNVAKTELMIIGSRQGLHSQCDEIDICIDDKMIKRVDHTKSLGLTIDAQLSWSKHVDEI